MGILDQFFVYHPEPWQDRDWARLSGLPMEDVLKYALVRPPAPAHGKEVFDDKTVGAGAPREGTGGPIAH